MQFAFNANPLEHELELRAYTATHLQPLLKTVVEACLSLRPENPTEFLRQWFNDGCPKLSFPSTSPKSTAETSGEFHYPASSSSRPSSTHAVTEVDGQELHPSAGASPGSLSTIVQLSKNLEQRVRDIRRASLAADFYSLSAAECETPSVSAVDDAITRGFLWHDGEVLRAVYSRHASPSGTMHSDALPVAVRDAFRFFRSSAKSSDAPASSSAHRDCLKFEDFRDFVISSSAVEGHLKRSAISRVLADAICAHCGSEEDSLKSFVQLSQESLVEAISAAAPGLLLVLRDVQIALGHSLSRNARAPSSVDCSKFHTNKMACGTVADFHQGLTARIGSPNLDFEASMRAEHCTKAGSSFTFTTGNYNITTTPLHEWTYVVGDKQGNRVACPDMGGGRRLPALDQLMQLPLVSKANLTRAEVVAVVMYTGPMFQIYNTILRRYPAATYQFFSSRGNTFSTTIFVLVSAVQKLSRCALIAPGTLLYRGLGGKLDLPDSFHTVDENGCLGYTEWGFVSTTAEKSVALQYSGVKEGRESASIMVIHPTSIDRGASIVEFSQYPSELEYLWVPCSFIQPHRDGATVELLEGGFVTIIPVQVNANLKTETVEELVVKKKNMHLAALRAAYDELLDELRSVEHSDVLAARMQRDGSPMFPDFDAGDWTASKVVAHIKEQCDSVVQMHELLPVSEFIDDDKFRGIVVSMLDLKLWAKDKLHGYMQDEARMWYFERTLSLKESHRNRISVLRQQIADPGASPETIKSASLKLLRAKGLIACKYTLQDSDAKECDIVTAVADGWCTEDIAAIISVGSSVSDTHSSGDPLLSVAAKYGHVHIIDYLLSQGCDPNSANRLDGQFQGCTALHWAAFAGHSPCVRALISSGASVNARDKYGMSPMHAAAMNNKFVCIQLLVAAGGAVDVRGLKGNTPLHAAAGAGHFESVRVLLASGASPSICDHQDRTPLQWAQDKGFEECAKLLRSFCCEENAAEHADDGVKL